jgi:hypothetical protein
MVMKDLKEDFGFHMNQFNQCYMFDTLPVQRNAETAEPGDLIFVQGRYHDHLEKFKGKVFKHDILHVEVFLGGPSWTKSIGSRRGTYGVAVNDSYLVPGDRNVFYTVERYHIRSLDTWLCGVCKSFCPEHSWLPRATCLCKKNVQKARSRTSLLSGIGKMACTFKPGNLGINYTCDSGKVINIKPGGQAESAGVKVGMYMLSIADSGYSMDTFKTASNGPKDYQIVFDIQSEALPH